jgi:hypothetical protein
MVDWNKDVSFRRKRQATEPVEPPAEKAEWAQDERQPSVWKKELRLGRKKPVAPIEPVAVVEDVRPAIVPEPVEEQVVVEPKQSIWKKEIGLGRKKPSADDELAVAAAEPVEEQVAVEPKQSIWK